MEIKSSKECLVVFLMEGEKFKLRNLPSRTSSQPWFLRRPEHILPGKTPACSCREASCHGKRNK